MKSKYIIDAVGQVSRLIARRRTAAIILAGGMGSRMGGSTPKQLLAVDGVPVIVRTAQAFQACKDILSIVIVSRREDIETIRDLCAAYGIDKLSKIVVGGETRTLSALAGFEAVESDMRYVAVHDAARCLITPEQISKVVRAAYSTGAAIAVCTERDTIKRIDQYGFVEETVDRNRIVHAQTPQVFEERLYRAAIYTTVKDKAEVTDDAQMVERIGHGIRTVDCGQDNFKITYEGDIAAAEAVLSRRRAAEESK